MYNFYNLFVLSIIKLILPLLKFLNPKLAERQKFWKESLSVIDNIEKAQKKRVWLHSASMGEFEQAKPIIELLKSLNSDLIIICSFFSPSGYNNQRKYEYADAIVYLPLDFRDDVRYFINYIKPDIAVFIRYEIWLNLLTELKNQNIPALLISATQPGKRNFIIKFLTRKYYYLSLSLIDEIFTVGKIHSDYFEKLNVCNTITTLADTRYDRIIHYIQQHTGSEIFSNDFFKNDEFVLVAGSTWYHDEQILAEVMQSGRIVSNLMIRLVIVPHEPDEKNIKRIQKYFNKSLLLSSLTNSVIDKQTVTINAEPSIIIVDSVGKLLELYKYADIAYIGGGFGAGVHSVAEPAGYGLPLICGPNIKNSFDAVKLIEIGSLKIIKNANEFIEWLNKLILDVGLRNQICERSKNYIYSSSGSSEIISERILKILKNQY